LGGEEGAQTLPESADEYWARSCEFCLHTINRVCSCHYNVRSVVLPLYGAYSNYDDPPFAFDGSPSLNKPTRVSSFPKSGFHSLPSRSISIRLIILGSLVVVAPAREEVSNTSIGFLWSPSSVSLVFFYLETAHHF